MFCVVSYETAEFEVVMAVRKGDPARAIHHLLRQARYFEQEVTVVRVVGKGLTYEAAHDLLKTASPWDGVKVEMP